MTRLDTIFLRFLRHFGEAFDLETYGIDMKTFKYVSKVSLVHANPRCLLLTYIERIRGQKVQTGSAIDH